MTFVVGMAASFYLAELYQPGGRLSNGERKEAIRRRLELVPGFLLFAFSGNDLTIIKVSKPGTVHCHAERMRGI
jgi:hypothetical protein